MLAATAACAVAVSGCSSASTPVSSATSGANRSAEPGGTAAASSTPGAKATRTTTESTKNGHHAHRLGADGTWDHSYHTLAGSPTVPRGSALKFDELSYDVIDGGWNLKAAFKYPGKAKGPIIYFALAGSNGRPTPATPFRLTTTPDLKVFIIGPETPRPTKVIIYQSTAHGGQGASLLHLGIPASAFAR